MSNVVRWRLSPSLRKWLLLTHISAAGAWLGLDLVLGILIISALTASAAAAASAAVSLAAFATWPLVGLGLITLATGIVLGVGSKYGLVRYWWVLVKLVLNVILTVLVLVALAPGVERLREAGLAALDAGAEPVVSAGMLFPPIVSSTAVLVAIALSVFKPWGRVRAVRNVDDVSRPHPDALARERRSFTR